MKYIKSFVLLCTVFCAGFLNAQEKNSEFDQGSVIDTVKVINKVGQTYALYIPEQYEKNKKWPVIFIFEPGARGALAVDTFKIAAEKYGYIIAASNVSRNGNLFENNYETINLMINDVLKKFNIDQSRQYVSGFSGGCRLATAVATLNTNICGVIGCGAGLPDSKEFHPTKESQFIYFGLVGKRDMNYLQMFDQEKYFNDLKIKNRLRIFNAGHEWPSSLLITEAVEWLELNSMFEKKAERNLTFIDKQVQVRKKLTEILLRNNLLLEYEHQLNSFISDFEDYTNINSYKEQIENIRSSKDYKKQEKIVCKIYKTERKYREEYIKAANKLVFERPVPDSIKVWWENEIKFLKKQEKKGPIEKQESASRLLNMISTISIEWSYSRISIKDFEGASELIKLGLLIYPESTYYHYTNARIQCLTGNVKGAIKSLEKSVEFGLKTKKHLDDPVFDILKNNKRFKDILNSL